MGKKQGGFTYVALLFVIAVIGVGLAAKGVEWERASQRDREAQLLFIGNEFRKAIALYYYRSPGPVHEFPDKLDDLLEDPRFPGTQRYLRRIYRDPMTGAQEWGLVLTPSGRIMGVHSLSQSPVIKIDGFTEKDKDLAGKGTYSDWEFVVVPPPAIKSVTSMERPVGRLQ